MPASARLGYSAPSSAFLAETILASTAAAILASRAAILASFAVAAASRQPFQALIKRSHTEKHTKTPYQHTNSSFSHRHVYKDIQHYNLSSHNTPKSISTHLLHFPTYQFPRLSWPPTRRCCLRQHSRPPGSRAGAGWPAPAPGTGTPARRLPPHPQQKQHYGKKGFRH